MLKKIFLYFFRHSKTRFVNEALISMENMDQIIDNFERESLFRIVILCTPLFLYRLMLILIKVCIIKVILQDPTFFYKQVIQKYPLYHWYITIPIFLYIYENVLLKRLVDRMIKRIKND
jgi:hypothetical protein